MTTPPDRALVLSLLNTIDALLKAHGFLSDPECRPVPCECPACTDARELLDNLEGN